MVKKVIKFVVAIEIFKKLLCICNGLTVCNAIYSQIEVKYEDLETEFSVEVRDSSVEFDWCWADLSSVDANDVGIDIIVEGCFRKLKIKNPVKLGIKEIHAFCDGSWLSYEPFKNEISMELKDYSVHFHVEMKEPNMQVVWLDEKNEIIEENGEDGWSTGKWNGNYRELVSERFYEKISACCGGLVTTLEIPKVRLTICVRRRNWVKMRISSTV